MQKIRFSPPERLRIPLRVAVSHASARRELSDSVLVSASRGDAHGLGEGCPRAYVTGETAEGAIDWLATVLPELESVPDLEALAAFAAERRLEIDTHPSAWCAAELAVLDLLASEQGISVEALLSLGDESRDFRYSAVLSLETGQSLVTLASRFLKAGMLDFKLRPTGDPKSDIERIDTLRSLAEGSGLPPPRVRLDGNNLWAGRFDECARYLQAIGDRIHALEEPLSPGAFAELARLSGRFSLPIVLDESARREEDLSRASLSGGNWVVNLKVSKAGGILRSLDMVRAVRALHWPICVGAHVGETSILTRAGLVVARASGEALVAQEGAFGSMLLERDPVSPSLSFGAGGVLRWPQSGASKGLGLARVEGGT